MPQPLRLFLSQPHPCSYLEEREATDLFIDPAVPMNSLIYTQLAQQGFRRSGSHIYRPHCAQCNECKPVRLNTEQFQPNRQQRRTWKKNSDLTVIATPTPNRTEHMALYGHYIKSRHQGGGMDEFEGDSPFTFFLGEWSDTLFYEFRNQQQQLLAVAVSDLLQDGLSAVYSYFDPEASQRSLGVMCVLWQIEQARQMQLPHLYLGYWIKDCQKMSYKNQYQPLEWYDGNCWQSL